VQCASRDLLARVKLPGRDAKTGGARALCLRAYNSSRFSARSDVLRKEAKQEVDVQRRQTMPSFGLWKRRMLAFLFLRPDGVSRCIPALPTIVNAQIGVPARLAPVCVFPSQPAEIH
jgi:hypothetical protein